MPRSFLIKKKPEKSSKNTLDETKPKGRLPDLRGETVRDSSAMNKYVQETPLIQPWNDFRARQIYPAEVTSCDFQGHVRTMRQDATVITKDDKAPLKQHGQRVDLVGQEAAENHHRSTDLLGKSSGQKKYKCDECQRSFSTSTSLRKHKHPQREFACKHCDKTYVSLGALKMHIRTHTLPCKCTICGKAFSRPWLLQGHIRTHTGEKPYQCPNCQRAFADRSNLRAHLQTHSTVKKYCCSQCLRSFSRMSLLLKHQYTCGNEL